MRRFCQSVHELWCGRELFLKRSLSLQTKFIGGVYKTGFLDKRNEFPLRYETDGITRSMKLCGLDTGAFGSPYQPCPLRKSYAGNKLLSHCIITRPVQALSAAVTATLDGEIAQTQLLGLWMTGELV